MADIFTQGDWVMPSESGDISRRELVYESDILALLDWSQLQTDALAREWTPGAAGFMGQIGQQLQVGLDVLQHPQAVPRESILTIDAALDRAHLVRGLLDIASNAWCVWDWVNAVLERLRIHLEWPSGRKKPV